MSPKEIIQKQFAAFDNRDIDAMMPLFSNDIQIINLRTQQITINGYEECKNMYVKLFELSPNLKAEITNMIYFENTVIAHEFILGRNGSNEKIEQVILFEINKDEKINKISVMREGDNS
jgi:hypothetical protein